jgi:hypothetical protein
MKIARFFWQMYVIEYCYFIFLVVFYSFHLFKQFVGKKIFFIYFTEAEVESLKQFGFRYKYVSRLN